MPDQLTSEANSWIVDTWSQSTSSQASSRVPQGDERADAPSLSSFIVQMMAQLLQSADSDEAARLLAGWLQQLLGCRQVVVGLCARHGRHCHIRGLSGVVRFDSQSRFIAAIQDALEETLAHESGIQWPPGEHGEQYGALAHEKLVAALGAKCVASVPLRNSDETVAGVVLFVDGPVQRAFDVIDQYGAAITSCLVALERQRRGVVTRHLRRLRDKLLAWYGLVVCVVVVSLGLLLALPWPYYVRCPCQIQPVIRRFVVAPYDGTLESASASPGDVVKAGDVVARMDEREIRWELAGLGAEFARARKERDAAMAAHRAAGAQLAKLEMERLGLQIKLLEHRVDNLAVRSPIDGIVVAGDLEKAQGAPLTIGQTLFEVAPLERMNVEVNVPEEDVSHVTQGMEVAVRLDAFPDDTLRGAVVRIHPQAELRDKESVFVAEFELTNPEGRLRPGMNGWAAIKGRKRSLAWILFHKPWTSLRRALAW